MNSSSIVLIGNFNPAIFHPEWFERFKILPPQEIQWAEGSNIPKEEIQYKGRKLIIQENPSLIVTPQFAHLPFQSLQIDVSQERFDCKAAQRKTFPLIKETTLKIFSLLKHTPIRVLGINFEGHWRLKKDGTIILKELFGKKADLFKDAMGESYEIGGKLITHEGDQQFIIDFSRSPILEAGIYFRANIQWNIESERTEKVVQLIKNNYDHGKEKVIKIATKLLGNPEETWKNGYQES